MVIDFYFEDGDKIVKLHPPRLVVIIRSQPLLTDSIKEYSLLKSFLDKLECSLSFCHS